MPDAGTVYQQYRDMVYGYLFRLCQNHDLAEELTQETFYQALKRWNGFRGKSDIGTWLCSIARNQYFQILRRKKEQPAGDAERETEPDFSEMVINRGIAIDAYTALHHLPEPYREVFSLRTFSDLNYREISEVFGKTESWARVTCYRAKQMLQEALKGAETHEYRLCNGPGPDAAGD